MGFKSQHSPVAFQSQVRNHPKEGAKGSSRDHPPPPSPSSTPPGTLPIPAAAIGRDRKRLQPLEASWALLLRCMYGRMRIPSHTAEVSEQLGFRADSICPAQGLCVSETVFGSYSFVYKGKYHKRVQSHSEWAPAHFRVSII